MSKLATTLSSSAMWGRERKWHQFRRFVAFMQERHPEGLPNLEEYGVANFYRDVYCWHDAKGFTPRDYPSERQLRRLRQFYPRADMSADLAP